MAILRVEKHNSSSTECVDKSSLQRRYRPESQWTFRCNIRSIIYPFHRCPIYKHIADHRGYDNLPTIFHPPRCLTMYCSLNVTSSMKRDCIPLHGLEALAIKWCMGWSCARLCNPTVCCSVSMHRMDVVIQCEAMAAVWFDDTYESL